MLSKITALNNLFASLADRPNTAMSAAELKTYFDSQPDQLKAAINAIVDALLSTATSDSGSHNVGSAAIAGITGDTVYEQLVSLKTAVDNAALGSIPDGSLTPQKLNFDPGIIAKDAAGTGTAISLLITPFSAYVDNRLITFIASANNSSSATTININGLGAKPLYKPGTTTAPNLIAGKAYTVWYDASANAFFIKASAEGTAVAGDVLAGKTFSNDLDTGLTGTIVNLAGQGIDLVSYQKGVGGASPQYIQIFPTQNGYYTTSSYFQIHDFNLIPENLRVDTNVLGVIGTLVPGLKSASGTATTDVNGDYTVTGLSFTPSIIISESTNLSPGTRKVYFSSGIAGFNSIGYDVTGPTAYNSGAWTVSSGSFSTKHKSASSINVNWWAYGT